MLGCFPSQKYAGRQSNARGTPKYLRVEGTMIRIIRTGLNIKYYWNHPNKTLYNNESLILKDLSVLWPQSIPKTSSHITVSARQQTNAHSEMAELHQESAVQAGIVLADPEDGTKDLGMQARGEKMDTPHLSGTAHPEFLYWWILLHWLKSPQSQKVMQPWVLWRISQQNSDRVFLPPTSRIPNAFAWK